MKRLLITTTIIGLLGLAAYYYFQSSGGVQDIEFIKLEKLKIEKITPFPKLSLKANAEAVLKNPNPFGVVITSLDFDIYVEDKHASKVSQDVSIDINGQSTFKLPLNFDIPLGKIGFFKDAKDILSGAWKHQSLKIKTIGTINIQVLKINIDLPFEEEEEYLLKDYLPD